MLLTDQSYLATSGFLHGGIFLIYFEFAFIRHRIYYLADASSWNMGPCVVTTRAMTNVVKIQRFYRHFTNDYNQLMMSRLHLLALQLENLQMLLNQQQIQM